MSGCDERMFLVAVEGVMRECVQGMVYHSHDRTSQDQIGPDEADDAAAVVLAEAVAAVAVALFLVAAVSQSRVYGCSLVCCGHIRGFDGHTETGDGEKRQVRRVL